MSSLRVRLFGSFEATYGQRTLRFGSRIAQDLFCYLLLDGERTHSREQIADIFWKRQSRKAVRQALWRIREALPHRVLAAEGDSLRVNRKALWLDVWEFERSSRPAGNRAALRQAAEL